ncbi:hypothetical protein [Kitasatospora sp. CB01950]|uniref:hypothetical protein n=1 Tax=Kitasatospora sp. CB01950 TaxID=1703930 RepID=UPI000938F756|nr:hypothetical protein [Kitasatospora sp. CB01950]OKJ17018.1 hypothetical protein AMK19_02525 [Kitasatospora sp. CB01950]
MLDLIHSALIGLLRLVLPTRGRHRYSATKTISAEPTTPDRPERRITLCEHSPESPMVRPYVDPAAWRTELDEMEKAYARQAALHTAVANLPDTGHRHHGAHGLTGAAA